MDNVGIVVDDLEAAIAFFSELGMELEGKAQIEGEWADHTVGLDGVHCDIAMLRTPDGHGRIELAKYHNPAAIDTGRRNQPHNTLGMHRIMFAVDDIDATIAGLRGHGAELVGDVAQYQDSDRLCYVRGPEGIFIGLASSRADEQFASPGALTPGEPPGSRRVRRETPRWSSTPDRPRPAARGPSS